MCGFLVSDLQKFVATALLLCLCAIGASVYGARYVLDHALHSEAQSRGMDWAHYVEEELASPAGHHGAHDGRLQIAPPTRAEFVDILEGVFAIGHIFQIDYINMFCNCDLSLVTSDVLSADGAPLPPERDTGFEYAGQRFFTFHQQDQTQPDPDHVAQAPPPNDVVRYPIDAEQTRLLATQDAHRILVHTDDTGTMPGTFAEVYLPVEIDGEPAYVLRVMVNLEAHAAKYKSLLLAGTAISLTILLFVVGYPIRRFLQSQKRQIKTDQRATFLANYDTLTGLPNRHNFNQTTDQILLDQGATNQQAHLFLFDLKNLKVVNNYYGHEVGDQLLCELAALLSHNLPEGGHLARLGGDEFAFIAPNSSDIGSLSLPHEVSIPLANSTQRVSASIAAGVAQFPIDATTRSELLQMADLALNAAKVMGIEQICEFHPTMMEQFQSRLDVKKQFCDALAASQIAPFYQPIINIQTGAVEGFEALARWHHPQKGVLSPFHFADALEDNQINSRLGRHMLEKITHDMADWTRADVDFCKVALNVAPGDLMRDKFAQEVLEQLAASNLPTRSLTLEVTENCLFTGERARFIEHLDILRQAGCNVALDDFGTGYSSITQLKEIPVNIVKIDKSFVDNIQDDNSDQSIIGALLDMGKSMQFDVVLEGVETENQGRYLQAIGCHLAQGFLYGRPMPAEAVPAFLAAWTLHPQGPKQLQA